MTPVVSLFIAFITLGIENVGVQIEEPFRVGGWVGGEAAIRPCSAVPSPMCLAITAGKIPHQAVFSWRALSSSSCRAPSRQQRVQHSSALEHHGVMLPSSPLSTPLSWPTKL